MAKVVLNDITNVATSLNDLNYNFTAIENAFADHLSRKPAATNHLETSLDLNSNNIYNVKYLQAEDLRVNGQSFTDNMSTVNSLISTSELIRNETTIIAAQAAASAEEAADIVVGLGDQVAQASASANLAYGYKVEAANSFTIAQEQAVAANASANTASAAALSASTNAAQTALDVIDTTADALQTGLDAVAASASKAAAAISETNAAISAAEAAASAGALTPVEDQILASAAKTTPVDTDEFGIVDTTVLKRLSWANVKATLLTYFNTVYATLAALNLKAPLASPALTGTPTAPTAISGTSTTQLATTAFVTSADALKADLASPTFTGTVGGITSTMIGNTPAGNIAATTVQAALNELDSEKAALAGNTSQSFSMLHGTVAGTLGVGTTAPTAKLTVAKDLSGYGDSTGFRLQAATTDTSNLLFGGASTALNASFLQSYKEGTSQGSRALLLNPLGGDVLVTGTGTLGYGTGAGGTVTQATDKSTAVTLNKPCGQITMNNAALAAGATVFFLVNNSLAGISDVVGASIAGGVASGAAYMVRTGATTGGFYILVKNDSAGSLSEALVLNFNIKKGATS